MNLVPEHLSSSRKKELNSSLLPATAPQLDHAAVESEFLRDERTERIELLPLLGVIAEQGPQPGDGGVHLRGEIIRILKVLLPRYHESARRALRFQHLDEQLVEPG